MKRKLFGVLVALALVCGTYCVPVPDTMFPAIRDQGVDVLQVTIDNLEAKFNAALKAFDPVNATCNGIFDTKITQCDECIVAKCTARAEAVCKEKKPNVWSEIMNKGVELITKDFLASALGLGPLGTLALLDLHEWGDVGKRIGKELGRGGEKLMKEIFEKGGKKVVKEIERVGEKTAKEIGRVGEKVGKEIGRGAEKVGKEIERTGKRIGTEAVRSGKKVLKEIGRVGKKLKKIFGRRRRRDVDRIVRNGEPGCDAIDNDSATACMFYVNSCSSCNLDKNTACPGYRAALDNLLKANDDRAWIEKIANTNYDIISITYDAAKFDPATGGFKDVQVNVNLFGNGLSFSVNLNPFDAVKAGPIIAASAIAQFRS